MNNTAKKISKQNLVAIANAAQELNDARAEKRRAIDREEEAREQLLKLMGERTQEVTAGSYRVRVDVGYADRIDTKRLAADLPKIAEQYTKSERRTRVDVALELYPTNKAAK